MTENIDTRTRRLHDDADGRGMPRPAWAKCGESSF